MKLLIKKDISKEQLKISSQMIRSVFYIGFWISLLSLPMWGQCDRWQNKADYEMFVDFDVETHNYFGKQTVRFYNASPDTLTKVYFHLYMNAFQPGSSMDVRSRTIADPDGRVRDRISELQMDEIGFQRIQKLRQGEQSLSYEVHETILVVRLAEPSLPGSTIEIYMEYDAQVPLQIRRNGRMNAEGIHYSMAQWYPRMCQYDHMGWHTPPYIGREFYGPFGSFDVKIRIDAAYTIGGTGYLQNAAEIGKGYSDKVALKLADKLTWHFVADRVHDFMWAADPEYTHDTYRTRDGIDLRFFYRKNERTEENWVALQPIMAEAFDYIQERFGKYHYKQYAFVQGGDGGMEYPMATLITGNRNLRSLVGVSVHELMHNWYQGVLGFNESLYHWMDEGFTSYATEIVMDHLIRKGLIPGAEPSARLFSSSSAGYKNIVRAGIEEPMGTHADHFDRNVSYGISAYSKGALYLHQLSYIIGQENVDKALLTFWDRCAFTHPDDNDFRRIAEQTSGLELKWYNEHWVYSTKVIDYGIDTVFSIGNNQSRIILDRIGNMPMPLDVVCTLRDGSTHLYHIPLDLMLGGKSDEGLADFFYETNAWKWVYPRYLLTVNLPFENIQKVEIDPSGRIQDLDSDNDTWPLQREE